VLVLGFILTSCVTETGYENLEPLDISITGNNLKFTGSKRQKMIKHEIAKFCQIKSVELALKAAVREKYPSAQYWLENGDILFNYTKTEISASIQSNGKDSIKPRNKGYVGFFSKESCSLTEIRIIQ